VARSIDPEIFLLRAEGQCTRGHKDKLLLRHCRLEVLKNVFSQRIVQDWNSLSEGTVVVTTLNICGTIGIKSGMPDMLSLIFRILVSWYPCCFNHVIHSVGKNQQLIFYLE